MLHYGKECDEHWYCHQSITVSQIACMLQAILIAHTFHCYWCSDSSKVLHLLLECKCIIHGGLQRQEPGQQTCIAP